MTTKKKKKPRKKMGITRPRPDGGVITAFISVICMYVTNVSFTCYTVCNNIVIHVYCTPLLVALVTGL